ncbi:MAG: hypothetical protein MI922_14840 [Bacteroidales bacterium]|nr:hypothetical protein [Bacteroidales bacterium]
MKTQKTNNFKANVLTVEQLSTIKGGSFPDVPTVPPNGSNDKDPID